MHKQTHIFAFILVSLSLHVVILAKLQPSTPESSFIKSDKLLRVELSSKSVPVSTPKKTITKTTAAAVNKNQPKHIMLIDFDEKLGVVPELLL